MQFLFKKNNERLLLLLRGYYCEEIFIPEQDNSLDLPLTFQQYKRE